MKASCNLNDSMILLQKGKRCWETDCSLMFTPGQPCQYPPLYGKNMSLIVNKYINKPFEKPSGCNVGELKSTLCACSHTCSLSREAKLFSYPTKPWPIFKRLGTFGNLSLFRPSLLYPPYPLPQQCPLAGFSPSPEPQGRTWLHQ